MMEMAGAALENEGGLDLRALLRLQAQAFKAAQAQIDAQQQQLGCYIVQQRQRHHQPRCSLRAL